MRKWELIQLHKGESMSKLSDFYGEIRKCDFCKIADGATPEGSCKHCFGRGYLAKCMNCDGAGQKEEPMAGGPGSMKSTCGPCGGTGAFGVQKPDYWDADQEKKQEVTA